MEHKENQKELSKDQIRKLTPPNGNSELLIKLFAEKDAVIAEQKSQINSLTTEVEILKVLNDDSIELMKKMDDRIKVLNERDSFLHIVR